MEICMWASQVALVVKNLHANIGGVKDAHSIPGSGRCPWPRDRMPTWRGGHGNPLQYSCLANLMDRGAWRATVDWVTNTLTPFLVTVGASQAVLVVKNPPAKAGDPRDSGLIPGLGRSPGEGNDNPFQYSCLENHIDRGAWWATVHGVAKSWTWLSDRVYTVYSGLLSYIVT